MKRYGRAVAIAWLVVAACGDDGGCRIEQEALIVLHSVPPLETCGYDAGSDVYVTDGIYDVGGRTGYVLAPVLLNNLVASTAEGSNTGVESGELQLEPDVDVSIHLPADVVDRLPADVSRSFTNYVATDSLDPGERYVTTIDLLSPELIEALPAAIDPGDRVDARVDVRFHVTRTGNSKGEAGVIDARDYSFPLDL
jgi:hypothetical protein